MTQTVETARKEHTGDNSTTSFAFDFPITAAGDISVYEDEVLQTITTHYTVSVSSYPGTGNIVFVTAPGTGDAILFTQNVPETQSTSFTAFNALPAVNIGNALDRASMHSVRRDDKIETLFGVSDTMKTTDRPTMTISEVAADRASRVLGFNAAGNALVAVQGVWNYKGAWAASTAYSINDVVRDTSTTPDILYVCTAVHTSSGSLPVSTNTDSAKWTSIITDGATGATGLTGLTGATGAAATLAVGSVTPSTVTVGNPATAAVVNAGSSSAATLNFSFGIPVGATGSTGSTGPTGPAGISPGLPFRFNSATSDSDKDAGDFWYNAAVGSATILYLDDVDSDGNAVSAITDTWDDGGSATHRGFLFVKQNADSSNMASFKVTGSIVDASGYSKVTVALLVANGTISDNDLCHIEFSATGTGGIANRTVDTMTGDNLDTTLALSQSPGSENNVTVTLDGVTQHHDTYALSGSTITFSTAPATGVKVEAVSGGLESIGTPSDGTVTLAKMAANSIDSDQYVDGSIDLIHLSADSVDGTKIADDAIDSEHYAAASIDEPHLADNSVDSRAYVDASIDSEHLATGIILNDVLLKDYGEVTDAKGSLGATPAFDLTAGNSKTGTVSEAITSSTFTNPTATDELCAFSLMLTNGGAFSVSWPTTVDWASATAPTLTPSGVDCLVFWTVDGGAIWNGSTVALNLS